MLRPLHPSPSTATIRVPAGGGGALCHCPIRPYLLHSGKDTKVSVMIIITIITQHSIISLRQKPSSHPHHLVSSRSRVAPQEGRRV